MKTFFKILICTSFAFCILSCATIETHDTKTDITYPGGEECPIRIKVRHTCALSFDRFMVKGFICTLTNISDKTVRIIWRDSSIRYNGNVYNVMLDGETFSDREYPSHPTIIHPHASITRTIYSPNQVVRTYNSLTETYELSLNWIVETYDFKIYICYRDGKFKDDSFIPIDIHVDRIEEHDDDDDD